MNRDYMEEQLGSLPQQARREHPDWKFSERLRQGVRDRLQAPEPKPQQRRVGWGLGTAAAAAVVLLALALGNLVPSGPVGSGGVKLQAERQAERSAGPQAVEDKTDDLKMAQAESTGRNSIAAAPRTLEATKATGVFPADRAAQASVAGLFRVNGDLNGGRVPVEAVRLFRGQLPGDGKQAWWKPGEGELVGSVLEGSVRSGDLLILFLVPAATGSDLRGLAGEGGIATYTSAEGAGGALRVDLEKNTATSAQGSFDLRQLEAALVNKP